MIEKEYDTFMDSKISDDYLMTPKAAFAGGFTAAMKHIIESLEKNVITARIGLGVGAEISCAIHINALKELKEWVK